MKKDRKTASTKQTSTPQIGRLTLLVGALVATGVLSPLSLPTATAASLPVPMGLPCGGCIGLAKNAPANLYSNFVQLGKVTTSNIDPITGLPSDNQLTIDQHDSQVAILNWQQFNIDKGNTVTFVQPSSTSSALNRIWDADPSHIAGNLNANGQIYLINRNGIVFTKDARVQVNTGALIASSLDIDNTLYQNGFLTNTRVLPAFGDGVNGIHGYVKVDPGAELSGSRIMLFAPVVENAGSIITPDGQTILAAGTKVYLQASQDPNLRGMLVEVDVDNAGVADPLLAGKGLQHTEAGVVTNAGDIASERGNTTLVGFAVNQQGRISATTSVTENGSIKLLARYNVAPESGVTQNDLLAGEYKLKAGTVYDIRATQTGKVTLAAGSVTAVTPQEIWDAKLQKWVPDTATTNDGQGFNPSIVEVMGNTIDMQSGSKIIVPGGQVTLAAISSFDSMQLTGLNPDAQRTAATPTGAYRPYYKDIASSSFLNPNYKPVSSATDTARVFLDKGSVIDVSGSSAEVSVARNILKVQLRGSQLADSPVQRVSRNLWGKDVLIDIRKGTALAAYAAEEAQIGRTVAERTATGGNVKLVSTGDVVMKRGAIVDISGGQVNYTGANIATTNVVVHGVAYDIAKATPEQIYEAVSGDYKVEHKKWGVTETFSSMSSGDMRDKPTIAYDVRWDPGYLEGKSAGSLTVLAPKAVVDGDIVAHTVAGIYQRQAYVDPATLAVNNYKNTWQMMPQGGLLVVGDNKAVADTTNSGLTDFVTDSKVTIQSGAPSLADNFTLFDPVSGGVNALPPSNQQDIVLNADKFGTSTGLNRLEVYSNSAVSVAEGTTVKLAPGGSITLQGGEVNMLGSIDAPSGKVKLGTSVTDPVRLLPGALRIGAAGTNSYISTRGRWVNDSMQWGTPDWTSPVLINGGNIDLSSGGDLLVASGTKLDASGGAWLDVNGKITGGNGGAITLASGKPQGVPFKAQLDGLDLRSYGTAGGKGGSLALRVDGIRLGGSATNGELVLPEAFFQNGGFSSYNLTAQGGLTVSEGAVIEPKTQSLIIDRTATQRRSGTDVTTFAKVGLLPEWQRKAANISLTANNGSSLTVEAGAVVRVEPTASISLSATNQLNVFGTLDARAGSINLTLGQLDNYVATQSIWLGSQSRLLSQGYFLQSQPNAQNLVQGQVLSGGKININANTGYVIAQQGSLMDVSGSSANVVLPQIDRGGLYYRTSHVAGDAGSIAVQTSEGGFFSGSMKAGVEAGSQAAAGTFTLTLNNSSGIANLANTGQFPQIPAQITISASGNGGFASQAGLIAGDDSAAGQTALTALAGKVLLDSSTLNKSGFDQVTLRSGTTISLADHADIQTRRSVTLDAPQLLVNGNSKITSGLVTIGNFDQSQQALLDPLLQVRMQPAAGTGMLNVSGQMVDLTGNFIVSGLKAFNVGSTGDIRLNGVIDPSTIKNNLPTINSLTGSLHTQGNVTLQAAQVYPSTLAQFTMSVEDGAGNKAGSITIQPGGAATNTVLSAGGLVTLSANNIEQNGVLKAPMGTINLDGRDRVTLGTGSLTSVSANGLVMPFGIVEGGNTWKYDLTGTGAYVATVDAPPQKQVKLTAPNIDVKSGATVDLSGNGDLYAHEFFAGSGGSVNVLDPAKAAANTFAIVPGISGYSPYDPQYTGQYNQTGSRTTLQPGASVYLAGGAGLKAGYYTLLPASYALLPGAYRITAVSGYGDRQPAQGVTTLTDGSQIMAGKFAVVDTNSVTGASIQDARFSGFMLTPNAVVRTQSEYHDSYANSFFATQANTTGTAVPRLASDAGQLIISATGNGATLALDGLINAAHAADGRGSMIDLNGPGFDIVNTTGPATGRVQLTTATLNKLGADSLLIGGVREQTATGMNVNVGAGEVVVNNAGSALAGPEIILAANNAVTVKAGSVIEGKGTLSGQASNITIANVNADATPAYGDGALLRVSSAAQVTVARTNLAAVPLAAKLTVEDGATVGAQNNAILLDSSNVATVGNSANLKGRSLSVAAQNIDIGNNPAPAPTSLALSGALLSKALAFKDLTLHSYNDINFYGTSALGGVDASQQHILNNLVLNSRSLNGVLNDAGQTSLIDAANVTLLNNNAGTSATVAYGTGNLKINADQITLAEGNKSIQGFDTVTLAAAKQIVAQGTSNVTVAAGDANVHNLVLQAGQVTGSNKSNLTVTATNQNISIQPVAGATVTASEALNAKLTIVGKSIANNGNIDLSSGAVTLHATGAAATDGVTLGSGSRTAATGISKVIAGQTAYAQAGSVSLIADNGDVDIRSGSVVDVRGAAAGGDAGTINISATKGAVTVAGELKGAANAKYAQGSFTLDARTLTGTGNALTNLNDILSAGGFTALRDMRLRTGNWVIEADAPGATSARAKAETFRLVADAGTIDVSGTVDASGTNGGSILLAANGNLTLNAGALLDAHASGAGQKGGKVTLETTTGTIELNNQYIDVHGDGNTGGSVLIRAPRNIANTDVNVTNSVDGTPLNVSTGANVTVEAFKAYTPTLSSDQLGATEVGGALKVAGATVNFKTEADNFAANAATIKARLGMGTLDPNTGLLTSVVSNQHLTPGVQIDSATNLTLSKDWDLSTWRFNDGTGALTETGILTLRSVGNMQFGTGPGVTASLTDGVPYATTNNTFDIKATGGPAAAPNGAYINPMTGPSWSYRLVSGADTTSADVMAVKNDLTGNFTLVAGKEVTTGSGNTAVTKYTMEQIRTGTGFIDIAAGGSFNLGNKDSVIYTFGQPKAGVPVANANTNNRYFGDGGGDISILAKGDVNGAATDQLVTDWQWREGLPNVDGTINKQPAWWINLQSFRQNVGALGGGNVSVKAGGNINTLSAVAPSTGYVDMVDPKHPTVVLGGGNLSVTAGGNINSGVFYVGNGEGTVRAGGNLGSNRKDTQNLNLYTVLALGQGNFDVRAGGDLNLETILNPTMIAQGISQMPSIGPGLTAAKTYFFTYGDTNRVSLTSLSGDVTLQNRSTIFYNTATARTNAGVAANGYSETGSGFFRVPLTQNVGASTVYPGSLVVNALGGSINGKNAMTLFSSATGDLQLIAAKDIQSDLIMSDAAASGLHADTVTTVTSPTLPVFSSLTDYLSKGRSSIHANDDNPVIISAGGNISGLMTLPKAAQIEAGQDVLNLGLTVQNLKSTDTTSIVAGRDISYITTTASTITTGITVDGPGQVVLQAGRNVDLGQYDGIITKGNLSNPLLPEQGASVTVLAGVGQGGSASQAFIDKYIDPNAPKTYGSDLVEYVVANWTDLVRHGQASGLKAPVEMSGAQAYAYFGKLSKPLQDAFAGKTYDKELIAYVSNYGGSQNMTPEQAYSYFSTLSKPLQESFVRQVFFSELRDGGRYAVTTKNYQTGFDAISALFPSTGYKGDINLYYSQIKTMRGGDINLLAPGGGVNAGLANPSATGPQKTPTELGIVTVKGGDVNAFVNNDFMVNQSRVFTLRGNSDILLWSSWGSIDAGKGSKSVSATPPPLLVVDLATGAFNLDTSRSIVGSGIGLLLTKADETPGSIDLVAPHGEVNAGDAGIRSAGNIFIAAPRVVGADNISFGGSGAGVPVAAPAPVSVGLNLQDASKAADQATQSIASTSGMNTNDFKPTFLSIEVIGLGDKDSNPDQ